MTGGTRPCLVVLVGLPGSGKSTWAARQGAAVISSDHLRYILSDDETNQAIHRTVFGLMRLLVRIRIELCRPVTYIDATHLTRRERRPWIKMAELYDCDVDAVFFDVPLEICKQRNAARGRVVPEEALQAMAQRLVPPAVEEGFRRVITVSALK